MVDTDTNIATCSLLDGKLIVELNAPNEPQTIVLNEEEWDSVCATVKKFMQPVWAQRRKAQEEREQREQDEEAKKWQRFEKENSDDFDGLDRVLRVGGPPPKEVS